MHDMSRRFGYHESPPIFGREPSTVVGKRSRSRSVAVPKVHLLQLALRRVHHQIVALNIGHIHACLVSQRGPHYNGMVIISGRSIDSIVFSNAQSPCIVVECSDGLEVCPVFPYPK